MDPIYLDVAILFGFLAWQPVRVPGVDHKLHRVAGETLVEGVQEPAVYGEIGPRRVEVYAVPVEGGGRVERQPLLDDVGMLPVGVGGEEDAPARVVEDLDVYAAG